MDDELSDGSGDVPMDYDDDDGDYDAEEDEEGDDEDNFEDDEFGGKPKGLWVPPLDFA